MNCILLAMTATSLTMYNEPLLRGHAALSLLHQVRGRKGEEEGGGGEARGREGGATQHSADCRQSACRNDLRLEGEINMMLGVEGR